MTEATNTPPVDANIELTQEQKDAASAAKYQAQNAPPVEPPVEPIKAERPEHIPEKFWDAEKGEVRVEELAKSYAELEKGKVKPDDKAADDKGKAPDAEVEAAQAEFSKLREETTASIVATGAPSEEQYAAYEKRGFSRDDIDAFIAGQQAVGQLQVMEVHTAVGGKEAYDAAVAWARSSFSPEEVAAYDRDVHSADKAVMLNAARGLIARYQQANGTDGRSVTGKSNNGVSGASYASKAEMVKDMQDPKYAKDAAFREEVAKKIQASRASGVNLTY